MSFWNRRRRKRKTYKDRLINDKIVRDIRTIFEQEKYCKPKRVRNFWNNNYIEYESNGDKNSNLWLDEYLNKNKPYMNDIIIDL